MGDQKKEILHLWHMDNFRGWCAFRCLWIIFFTEIDVIIVTSYLYVLISVWMTWTFRQGHRGMRKQKAQALIFSQISPSLWLTFNMLLGLGLLKLLANYIMWIEFQEDYLTELIMWKRPLLFPSFGCLWTDFFQTWYDEGDYWNTDFDTGFHNLDFFSVSYGHNEAIISAFGIS